MPGEGTTPITFLTYRLAVSSFIVFYYLLELWSCVNITLEWILRVLSLMFLYILNVTLVCISYDLPVGCRLFSPCPFWLHSFFQSMIYKYQFLKTFKLRSLRILILEYTDYIY